MARRPPPGGTNDRRRATCKPCSRSCLLRLDEEVEEAVYHALARTAYSDGKPDTALPEALEDAGSRPGVRSRLAYSRRSRTTTCAPSGGPKATERPEPNGPVFAALRACSQTVIRSACRILVELLDESCRDIAWQAEELLRSRCGRRFTAGSCRPRKREQRRCSQAAWHRWLRERGTCSSTWT